MNRKIKFRIWNDYDKKMIYWNELLKNNICDEKCEECECNIEFEEALRFGVIDKIIDK